MNNFLCWFIGHFERPDYAVHSPYYWCDRCKNLVPDRWSSLPVNAKPVVS